MKKLWFEGKKVDVLDPLSSSVNNHLPIPFWSITVLFLVYFTVADWKHDPFGGYAVSNSSVDEF